jgi:hypothetical protein
VVGFAVGLAKVELFRVAAGVQAYVFPPTAAPPIVMVLPAQIVLFAPVVAAGSGFTVTVFVSLAEQPVEVVIVAV